jgi:hypothetical protein
MEKVRLPPGQTRLERTEETVTRVVCYNILADMYATSDYSLVRCRGQGSSSYTLKGIPHERDLRRLCGNVSSPPSHPKRFPSIMQSKPHSTEIAFFFCALQKHLYDYLDPSYLASDYRSQLTLRELQAYNADVICLQEVCRYSIYVYMAPMSI